jgi:hypothetical protein
MSKGISARLKKLIGVGVGAMAVATFAVLGAASAAGHNTAPAPSDQTLRALAARQNLYVARSQMTAGVQAGDSNEINPRLQASAANFSVLLQGCLANRHCLSFTVWGFTDKHSWVPGAFSNPPEGLATLYDENYQPKLAYQMLKADLAFSGAPLVLPRIPQVPKR